MCGIYKIENLINGKVYIGQSVNIQYRLNNHKSESFNPKSNSYNTAIHRAIRKYGIENFSFEIIEECEQDKLYEREIFWIEHYHSFGKGYNMTNGGEGVPTIDIKQVQRLWDEGLSIESISTTMSCGKHTIIRILEDYANYNKNESYKRGRINARKKMCKPILQYDLYGNFIKKYNSISEASQETKIRGNDISAVLTGRQLSAKGYQWIYDGDDPPSVYSTIHSNEKKKVLQFDLQGNFVAEYSSMVEASKSIGLSNPISITRCCKNNSYTAGGYYWRWKNEADKNAH